MRRPRGAAGERASTLGRRRGRAAAQGRALRQGRRPALRLHLGLDQVDARLGPRRLALLPRGDARGRRGPALHRPAHDRARLRGHRQRRPAGARRWRSPRRTRSSTSGFPEAEFALAQAAIYLSLAPKSDAVKRAIGAARGHIREHGAKPAAGAAALGRLPGGAQARAAASATTTRTATRATSTTRSTCPRGSRTCASTSPTRASPRRRRGSRRSGRRARRRAACAAE